MEIALANYQKKIPLQTKQIQKIAQLILRYEGVHSGSLSLVFVTRQKIRALNKKFLDRSTATDVLAFDLRQSFFKTKKRGEIIGEIIISPDAAKQNAKIYGTSVGDEIILYVTHGILHLLGYDDHDSTDIKKRREKEKEILQYLSHEHDSQNRRDRPQNF